MSTGWIGVDLDGTLAEYNGDADSIGNAIPRMLDRIKSWLIEGKRIKIFTARVSQNSEFNRKQRRLIHRWLTENGLPALEITCKKDFLMIELWDDRCIQVIKNTGLLRR